MKDKTTTYSSGNSCPSAHRYIAAWIFVILFASYAYFHQGGGWNQNSRFDQVRSIVENQQLEINEYLRYRATRDSFGKVKIFRLKGGEKDGLQSSVLPNTLDISVFAGKVYPNKPPGTVFLALPAYWLVYHAELLIGLDPDDWWIQTLNAYFSTALSVGLLTAIGGVVFYLTSRRLFPEAPDWAHAATTIAYSLGTLILPFATLLVDHDAVATLSLCTFYLLLVESQGGFVAFRTSMSYFFAGVLCGLVLVVNYAAILTVALLFLYGLHSAKRKAGFGGYGAAGFAVPVVLLLWYHAVSFGSPLATANTYQFGLFRSEDTFALGMFTLPRPEVIYKLLFSSYRGLFFTSPVLILAPLGLVLMAARKTREALLFTGIFGAYLWLNASFYNWHAGWTFGPRYMIPALPFFCLPLVPVFRRLPRTACMATVVSVALMLLITAVDPQVPSSIGNPLRDHILALAQGKKLVINGIVLPGPISANPLGVYETWDRPQTFVSGDQRRWHSFNLGEFLREGSFWSLLPLVTLLGVGIAPMFRPMTAREI
jgi:hypothetical protein